MSDRLRLHYLFDPLCGWCYGAAPAVAVLASRFAGDFTSYPVGLFVAGARTMTPDWANFVWTHDQRIGRMTGQTFSDAYRDQVVVGGHGRPFDAGPSTRALTLLTEEGESEVDWLHRFQRARFVDGRDTSDPATLAEIIAEASGRPSAALARRLKDDEDLARATDERIREGQLLMRELALGGVPAVVIVPPHGRPQLPSSSLYNDPSRLIAEIESAG